MPPKITVPPGANIAEPGVFKSMHGIVRLVDLRVRFGVDEEDRSSPGRVVVVEVEGGHAGFWVDEIEDVIGFPSKGWMQVPAHLPKDIFTRTLMHKENIRLYADFEQLDKLKVSGYLRKHIEILKQEKKEKTSINEVKSQHAKVEAEIGENKKQTHINDETLKGKKAESEVKSMAVDSGGIAASGNKVEPSGFVQKNKTTDKKPEIEKHDIHRSLKGKVDYPDKIIKHNPAAPEFARPLLKGGVSEGKKRSKNVEKKSFGKVVDTGVEKETVKVASFDEPKIQEEKDRTVLIVLFGAAVAFVSVLYFALDFDWSDRDEKKSAVPVYQNTQLLEQGKNKMAPLMVEAAIESVEEKVKNEEALHQVAPALKKGSVDIRKNDDGMLIVVNEYIEEPVQTVREKDRKKISDAGLAENDKVDENAELKEIAGSVSEQIVNIDISEENKEESNKLSVSEFEKESLIVKEVDQSVESSVVKKEEDVELIENEKHNVSDVTNVDVDNKVKGEIEERKSRRVSTSRLPEKTEDKTKESSENKISSVKHVHLVVKGDTLWHIAKRYVNNPWRYPELARLSDIKNPDLIYPGDKVTIIINYRAK